MERLGRVGRSSGGLTNPSVIDRLAEALAGHEPAIAQRDPPFREAAVALVLTPNADDANLLLLRRATHAPDPWSGQIALPGGRMEATDMTLLDTAIRETREETMLELREGSNMRLLGVLDELRPRTPSLPPIIVRPFVMALDAAPALTPSIEVAELFWAPISALFDRSRATRATVLVRGAQLTVDAIEWEGRVIWGMTERILRTLERALSSPR